MNGLKDAFGALALEAPPLKWRDAQIGDAANGEGGDGQEG